MARQASLQTVITRWLINFNGLLDRPLQTLSLEKEEGNSLLSSRCFVPSRLESILVMVLPSFPVGVAGSPLQVFVYQVLNLNLFGSLPSYRGLLPGSPTPTRPRPFPARSQARGQAAKTHPWARCPGCAGRRPRSSGSWRRCRCPTPLPPPRGSRSSGPCPHGPRRRPASPTSSPGRALPGPRPLPPSPGYSGSYSSGPGRWAPPLPLPPPPGGP